MYHISNEEGNSSLCPDFDLINDELVPFEEAKTSNGRWFNCGSCFEVLHGSDRRPNPPAVGDAS